MNEPKIVKRGEYPNLEKLFLGKEVSHSSEKSQNFNLPNMRAEEKQEEND